MRIRHSRNYDELSLKENGEGEKSFAYLLSMPLLSLTKEKVEQLKQERHDSLVQLDDLEATSPETMWTRDLDALLEAMELQERKVEEEQAQADRLQKKQTRKKLQIGRM